MQPSGIITLLLLSGLAGAVSLETISYENSTWFKAVNDGQIAPNGTTFLNASGGNAQMIQGATIEEALQRDWVDWRFGLARWTGTQFQAITTDDLSRFNCTGASDNASYWLTDCGRSFALGTRTATLNLTHGQGAADDFVNETWIISLSGVFISAYDVYYVEALTNLSYLDHVQVDNETWGTGHSLSENRVYRNVTAVGIMNAGDGIGWQYRLERGAYGNLVVVRDGVVYIGLNLGRTLSGTNFVSLEKVDVECVVSCLGGASISYTYGTLNSTNLQVPFNTTVEVKATDSGGDCTMSNQCYWMSKASNIYLSTAFVLGYQDTNSSKTASGSNWLRCNRDHPNDNCDADAGDGNTKVQFYCPLEQVCDWQLTVAGNYTKYVQPSWGHSHRILFNNVLKATEAYRPADTTAPQIYCPNNSVVYGASYVTPCIANNTVGGLVNNSQIWTNQSGTFQVVQLYNEVDNTTVALDYTFAALSVGDYIRYCWGSNSTNYLAGLFGYNWTVPSNTCFEFRVEETPPAGATANPTIQYAKAFWRGVEFDLEFLPKGFDYRVLFLVAIGLVVGVVSLVGRK